MSKRKSYNFSPAPEGAPEMWRSLEDKARPTEEKNSAGEAEFQSGLLDTKSVISRRSFLAFTGATSAALSMEGCIRRPAEKILPYSQAPEYIVPGNALHYATVTERRGDALGLLVTSYEGRPTKVEGNPNQSQSLGATDVFAQASILNLYNADRAKFPTKKVPTQKVSESTRTKITAEAFQKEVSEALTKHNADQGQGLRILLEPTNSPSVIAAKKQVLKKFPKAKIHTFTSVNESNKLAGAQIAFGKPVETVVDYEKAETVLSVDADFLSMEQGAVKASQGFAKWRKIDSPQKKMNRLYVVESTFSVTGANADHRLRVLPSQVGAFLKALAKELVQNHSLELSEDIKVSVSKGTTESFSAIWLTEVAKELTKNKGKGAVVVGSNQPPSVHALAHVVNAALNNTGPVISYFDVADASAPVDQLKDLKSLTSDISKGLVQNLFFLGGNPVYQAPADLKLSQVLSGAKGLKTFQLSVELNETSQFSDFHFPGTHELEAWGDQQAVNGTRSIQQPLIAPLFGGLSNLEMLDVISGQKRKGYDIVRETFAQSEGSSIFNQGSRQSWRNALHQGVVSASASKPQNASFTLATEGVSKAASAIVTKKPSNSSSFEVVFTPDYRMFDGRFNNNPWMLELPDPLTKLVWDNGALVSPATAQELGINKGDILKVSNASGESIEIPAWILPGHADKTLTLPLGWGRKVTGQYGKGTGFDVSAIRSSEAFWNGANISVEKTAKTFKLVETQEHGYMEGRPIAIDANLDEYKKQPDFASWRTVEFTTPPLWEEVDYSENHKWGKTIDLSACTGCNTCVIACQAENNIPVVGKKEVARGREMSWIRIDRYFVGDDVDNPEIALQPVACQHCEEAPCENVCPVNATAHSPEGLNDMAYNRCIGTRYCANNCPYKVRRFNFLSWQDDGDPHGEIPAEKRMQFNPNVTVRMRGVMEKCSYCVQRIQEAKIHAKSENRKIRDGEITTACQQACPSQAIAFGDLNDVNSKVAKLAKMNRQYKLLAEVGAQPRTTFLAKIRNPNQVLQAASNKKAAHLDLPRTTFSRSQESIS